MKIKKLVLSLIFLSTCFGLFLCIILYQNRIIRPVKQYSIPQKILDQYIVQGVCRAEDYILVSAYQPESVGVSSILVLDLDGNLLTYVQINSVTHAGGITYDGKNVYVAGLGSQEGYSTYRYEVEGNPKEALIEVYDLNMIVNQRYIGRVIDKKDLIYIMDEDELLFSSASKVGNSLVSELDVGVYEGEKCLFVSNYHSSTGAHLIIIPFTELEGDSPYIETSKMVSYNLPIPRAQGVCYLGNNTFLFTQSNGINPSRIIECRIHEGKIEILGKKSLPAHSEQVSLLDENTIMVAFEYDPNPIKTYRLDRVSK